MDAVIAERRQAVLYDEKWTKFIRRARLFRHIPFVEFVFGAGSLTYGKVRQESDFDVMVGTKQGRIFTVRFFSVFMFGILGWRRKKLAHDEDAQDKICLNHFVTPKSYRLRDPHNEYEQNLYRNIVPLYGTTERVNSFLKANSDWMGSVRIYRDDMRHIHSTPSVLKKIIEFVLSGKVGDFFEHTVKTIQVRKINRGLLNDPPGHNPRIVYNDDELEFHPNTKRAEELPK